MYIHRVAKGAPYLAGLIFDCGVDLFKHRGIPVAVGLGIGLGLGLIKDRLRVKVKVDLFKHGDAACRWCHPIRIH
jgi:hypothetical protein